MTALTDQLSIAFNEGKKAKLRELQMAGDTREPSPRSRRQHPVPRWGIGGYDDHPFDDFGDYRGPTIPNPNPAAGFDWASGPNNNTKVAHRSHDPSFIHDGIPRYGWGDDSHDPNQHNTPVDDYNNPIPSLTPTDEEIDRMNGLQISGNPFGYSDEYLHRSKTLYDLINDPGQDPATRTRAQKEWIQLQKTGDIWKRVDAGGGDQNIANVWGHETPSDTFNRQNYPGRGASDELRIDHMRKYHDMKKRELA